DAGRPSARGFALISALLFLIVITLIGVSLFLGVNMQQKAAGNSLQKARALQLANSVTLAAERWLANNYETSSTKTGCSGSATAFRICSNEPTDVLNPGNWNGATTVDIKDLKTGVTGNVDNYY